LLLVIAGAAAVWKFASVWLGDPGVSTLAASTFAFYCGRQWALSSYGEFYVMFPTLLAARTLLQRGRTRAEAQMFAGVMLGVAFFFKQTAVFDAGGLWIAFLIVERPAVRLALRAALLVAGGFLLVAVAVSAVFLIQHA